MNISKYILILLLSTVVSSLNTVLNVDEINSVHYAIDIVSKPVLKDQVWEGDIMTVVNKHGQEYICSLPSVAPSDPSSKSDENILDQLVDISGLLKPMETAPCLIKTVDWWTYEFCYGSVIKQYHLEDNKASGPILILGKYESEYNWKNSSETKNRLQRFHSQFYVNGTKCDLTGEPRRTEVRFHCEDGVGDYIQRVDEPESCRYVVTVATTRVCHHPYLRLQAARTPHAITCAPALTEEQYHRYLSYQDKKLKEEETLKEKWLKQNAELLGAPDSKDGRSNLEPITSDSDEDEELKMNIKIFRLSPFKKQKNSQSPEAKNVMEVETQITLEETEPKLKVEEIKLSTETEDSTNNGDDTQDVISRTAGDATSSDKEGGEKDDGTFDDGIAEDGESLISDIQAQELLQLLDPEDAYLTEEDEVEDLDDDDDEDEEDEEDNDLEEDNTEETKPLRQASKSTNRAHYMKLQQRVKQLGKMFMNGETGTKEEKDDKFEEIQQMVDNWIFFKERDRKEMEKEVKEWIDKEISKEMDEDELEEEEQRLDNALSSLMEALSKSVKKLSTAKKSMETLEEFLDNQLKEMEDSGDGEDVGLEGVSSQDGKEKESQDPTEGISHTLHSTQDTVEDSSLEEHEAKSVDKGDGSTRQLRIMKNRMEDESQKTKLEQTIKDRLQKLGLDKIGRKFEVKILTPNSLEDEDTNNPLLSQEETEAFQNMIVNLLNANAEELEERENHRKLEKNYGFRWDDSQVTEEEEEEEKPTEKE